MAAERLEQIAVRALPAALDVMAHRHDNLLGVIQYLEGAYLLAQHNKTDRSGIEKEAKLYLNEALVRVASDIDTTAANLEQLLVLELGAVDSLSQQVACVQSRLALARQDAARRRLAAFLGTLAKEGVPEEEMPRQLASSVLSSEQKTFAEKTTSSRILKGTNRRMSMSMFSHSTNERPSLAERLSRLDSVGTIFDCVDVDVDVDEGEGEAALEAAGTRQSYAAFAVSEPTAATPSPTPIPTTAAAATAATASVGSSSRPKYMVATPKPK